MSPDPQEGAQVDDEVADPEELHVDVDEAADRVHGGDGQHLEECLQRGKGQTKGFANRLPPPLHSFTAFWAVDVCEVPPRDVL